MTNRRTFLQKLGAGAAGIGVSAALSPLAASATGKEKATAIREVLSGNAAEHIYGSPLYASLPNRGVHFNLNRRIVL